MRVSALIIATLAVLGAVSTAAQAQVANTAYASDNTGGPAGPNSIGLSIPVTASIGAQCGYTAAPSGTVNQPNFDTTGIPATDFAFTLLCSTPYRVAVSSANGGLKNNATGLPTGYAALAPYSVTLNLVGTSAPVISATCTAESLAAGGPTCLDANPFAGTASTSVGLRYTGSANNEAGSYLRVSAPAYAGGSILVGGSYTDTLTVTLSAAP